jgi:hypothetical protein
MTDSDCKTNSKKGRKPKGAKITLKQIDNVNSAIHVSNIILHLKCTSTDIAVHKKRRIGENLESEPEPEEEPAPNPEEEPEPEPEPEEEPEE